MTQHHVQYLGPNKMTAMTLSLIGVRSHSLVITLVIPLYHLYDLKPNPGFATQNETPSFPLN